MLRPRPALRFFVLGVLLAAPCVWGVGLGRGVCARAAARAAKPGAASGLACLILAGGGNWVLVGSSGGWYVGVGAA